MNSFTVSCLDGRLDRLLSLTTKLFRILNNINYQCLAETIRRHTMPTAATPIIRISTTWASVLSNPEWSVGLGMAWSTYCSIIASEDYNSSNCSITLFSLSTYYLKSFQALETQAESCLFLVGWFWGTSGVQISSDLLNFAVSKTSIKQSEDSGLPFESDRNSAVSNFFFIQMVCLRIDDTYLSCFQLLISISLNGLYPMISVNLFKHSFRNEQWSLPKLWEMSGLPNMIQPVRATLTSSGKKKLTMKFKAMSSQLFFCRTISLNSWISRLRSVLQRSRQKRGIQATPTNAIENSPQPKGSLQVNCDSRELKSKLRGAQVINGAMSPIAYLFHFSKLLNSSVQLTVMSSSMEKNTLAVLSGGTRYLKSMELQGVLMQQTGRFQLVLGLMPASQGEIQLFHTTDISVIGGQSMDAQMWICLSKYLQSLSLAWVTVSSPNLYWGKYTAGAQTAGTLGKSSKSRRGGGDRTA